MTNLRKRPMNVAPIDQVIFTDDGICIREKGARHFVTCDLGGCIPSCIENGANEVYPMWWVDPVDICEVIEKDTKNDR